MIFRLSQTSHPLSRLCSPSSLLQNTPAFLQMKSLFLLPRPPVWLLRRLLRRLFTSDGRRWCKGLQSRPSNPEVSGVAMETAGAPWGCAWGCSPCCSSKVSVPSVPQRLRLATTGRASPRALYLRPGGFVRTSRVDWVSLLHWGGVTGFRLPPAVGIHYLNFCIFFHFFDS